MNLPADLVAFLTAGKNLEYDPDPCEVGAVRLVPLAKLKPQRFPVAAGGENDPNAGAGGSYLVLAVNLIARCSEDYAPAGLLLWLPVEGRYAAWDSDHLTIDVFGEDVTWGRIAEKPVGHLEASIGGDGYDPPFERLVPWLSHPHSKKSLSKPQPA
jgi:hypothetical protein